MKKAITQRLKQGFITGSLMLLATVTTLAGGKSWGLGGYGDGGQIPTGTESAAHLAQYDAYYVGTNGKEIYLTFDAGYEAGYTEGMLDVLKQHQVPAAFFLTGNYVRDYPQLIERMVAEGHTVANHTMTHPDMTQLDRTAIERELTQVNVAYEKITGQPIPHYYRPPKGTFTDANLEVVQALGYKTIFWSLAYVDYDDNAQPSKEQAFSKLIPRVHDGCVLLLHNTSQTNSLILDELIQRYKAMGYTFGTLDSLTGRSETLPEATETTSEQPPAQGKKKFKTFRQRLKTAFVPQQVYGNLPLSGKVIMIDAGHGGFDPGKVQGKVEEQTLNLDIALKLQAILEMSDAYVLMTRTDENAIGRTKDADMQSRQYLAHESEADILISIHQNAFTTGGPVGPMVFHHNEGDASTALATSIQKHLNTDLKRSAGRAPKQNKTYFILRKVAMPAVIVECGFMTNSWDFDCLRQEDYRDKVAWAIYKGVVEYFDALEVIVTEQELAEDTA